MISSFEPYSKSEDYRTAEEGNTVARAIPGTYFYSRLLWVIVKSGIQAKYGTYTGDDWVKSSLDILRALETIGVHFEVTGLQNIERVDGPVVFVSNHMSTLETMVMPCLVQPRNNTTFVVKQELLNYPFFKHVLGSRDPLEVGRENPREDLKVVLTEGRQTLKAGTSIILFPQRTRSVEFHPDGFNSLGVKLAQRSNVPVIPVALATDAWGNGKLIKEVGPLHPEKTVHFSFGEPLTPENDSDTMHRTVLEFIRESLRSWGRHDCLPD